MKTVCTLEEALSYENDEVIYRFLVIYKYKMPFEEARQIFIETKKWIGWQPSLF